ncbi:hypothetical protein BJ875DRAFT_446683 [Amylocarpus encephaloides]|uniref:Uncharacterized protein n=1 Tax=Amylocarpus encephaloides TaxID=45428 RepID=A0A9P7Y7R9_9HELO|nr:hypothetical protein BJ875DRAFT_446683 [Amylocarpus encephaloides]
MAQQHQSGLGTPNSVASAVPVGESCGGRGAHREQTVASDSHQVDRRPWFTSARQDGRRRGRPRELDRWNELAVTRSRSPLGGRAEENHPTGPPSPVNRGLLCLSTCPLHEASSQNTQPIAIPLPCGNHNPGVLPPSRHPPWIPSAASPIPRHPNQAPTSPSPSSRKTQVQSRASQHDLLVLRVPVGLPHRLIAESDFDVHDAGLSEDGGIDRGHASRFRARAAKPPEGFG